MSNTNTLADALPGLPHHRRSEDAGLNLVVQRQQFLNAFDFNQTRACSDGFRRHG